MPTVTSLYYLESDPGEVIKGGESTGFEVIIFNFKSLTRTHSQCCVTLYKIQCSLNKLLCDME